MRTSTPSPDVAAPLTSLCHVASNLATAAELFSKAAAAMVEVACAMSEAAQALRSMDPSRSNFAIIDGESTESSKQDDKPFIHNTLPDDVINISSGFSSEASSEYRATLHANADDSSVSEPASKDPVIPTYRSEIVTFHSPENANPTEVRLKSYQAASSANILGDISSRERSTTRGSIDITKLIGSANPVKTVEPAQSVKNGSLNTIVFRPLTLARNMQDFVSSYPKLPWGRDYIRFEEDFDAIPTIAYIALANQKTICFVPGSESLAGYKELFGAITGLEVFEQSYEQFQMCKTPAMLLLAIEDLSYTISYTECADCVVHWGWPENQDDYLKLMDVHTRSCLILPAGDHFIPPENPIPSSYGVARCPPTIVRSCSTYEAPIVALRKKSIQVLSGIDPKILKTLYHSWIEYYGTGPNRRIDWGFSNLIDYARGYTAKILLQGSPNDGSQRYPPVSKRRLPLPDWVVEEAAAHDSGPSTMDNQDYRDNSMISTSGARATTTCSLSSHIHKNSSSHSNDKFSMPGRYFVVLEEEFDAIPLMAYIATERKKAICYVPSPESVKGYRSILQALTSLEVTCPTGMIDADSHQKRLASASKPALLIQFYYALCSAPLQPSDSDITLVHCGIPVNPDAYVNAGAEKVTNSYIILSSKEYSNQTIQGCLSRLCIKMHPLNTVINERSNHGLLFHMREKALAHFREPAFSTTAKMLYYAFISYHCTGRGRPPCLTPEQIVRGANRYAARSLFRGTQEDGSTHYPPVTARPVLSNRAIKTFKLERERNMGLLCS